jgi:hypothetical protein
MSTNKTASADYAQAILDTNIKVKAAVVGKARSFVSSDPIVAMADYLSSVDENSPQVKLNETSIPDNNGGRIELVNNPMGDNIIRK